MASSKDGRPLYQLVRKGFDGIRRTTSQLHSRSYVEQMKEANDIANAVLDRTIECEQSSSNLFIDPTSSHHADKT
jgi:predicted transcriptional regulator